MASNGRVKIVTPSKHLKQVTSEFYAWKKTPEYKRWRNAQWAKQTGLCYYCNCDLTKVRVNIEHVRPRSRGGSNNPKNLVLACAACNKEKGSRKLTVRERKLQQQNHRDRLTVREEEVELGAWLRSIV